MPDNAVAHLAGCSVQARNVVNEASSSSNGDSVGWRREPRNGESWSVWPVAGQRLTCSASLARPRTHRSTSPPPAAPPSAGHCTAPPGHSRLKRLNLDSARPTSLRKKIHPYSLLYVKPASLILALVHTAVVDSVLLSDISVLHCKIISHSHRILCC